MAEVSSPREKDQTAMIPLTKCQLCEVNNIQFECLTCEENMCTNCKISHERSKATRGHKITKVKDERESDGEEENKCRSHPAEDIVMFCKECRSPVCMDCIASGSHQQHKLSKIRDVIDEKLEELSKIIDEAHKKLSISEDKIKSIRKMGNQYSKDVNQCIEEVKTRNVQLKSMLDQITSEVIEETQIKSNQHIDVLKQEENRVDNDISTLKQMIHECKEQQKNRENKLVQFVTDVRNKLDQLQLSYSHDSPSQPSPPVFVTNDIDIQKLRIIFGEIDPEDDKSSDFEISTEVIQPITKSTIDIEVVSTFTMKDKSLVAAVSNAQAWVGGYACSDISLVLSDGEVIQTVKTDFDIHDMAVTTIGELLVTTSCGGKVKKMKSKGKFTDVFVAPFRHATQGITVTDENHIIVSLQDSHRKQGKLVRLSSDGELLQTIQYDGTDGKTPLFVAPYRVSWNKINCDYIVIDRRAVVIVTKAGHNRCSYTGQVHQSLKKLFNPWYTVTDKYGHILISDYNNDVIHLLDSEGKFLQFVLTHKHQLDGPQGMSIDTSSRLWVRSRRNDKVKIVKYV